MAVGAGAVWVTTDCGPRRSRFGFLVRIDARTNRVTRAVALGATYHALAAGSLGVWGATSDAEAVPAIGRSKARAARFATLQRIGLRDGRPTVVTRLPAGGVGALDVSRDAVWATRLAPQRAGAPAGALLRVDPHTGRVSTVLVAEQPGDVSVGEQGVWVLDGFARTVTRVRP